MYSVTVYTKPNCPQCRMTYLKLGKEGIEYTSVDVTENAQALMFITEELGYSQAPVVVVDQDIENHWSGFRPDRIESLAKK